MKRTSTYDPAPGETRYCGNSFSIVIPATDKFIQDPNTPEDFALYHWKQVNREIAIYEGNHPQPGGVVMDSRIGSWPEYVVVHGTVKDAKAVRIFRSKPDECKSPILIEETE